MGLVIEEATGRSYYEEIKDRFLTPLNLNLTAPSDQRYLPGLAAGYMAEDNSFGFPRKTIDTKGMMEWHPGFEWTGGGLVSNSRDLAEWGAALFNGKAMLGDYLTDILQAVPISPVDDATPVVNEMEKRLAQIAITANNSCTRTGIPLRFIPAGDSQVKIRRKKMISQRRRERRGEECTKELTANHANKELLCVMIRRIRKIRG